MKTLGVSQMSRNTSEGAFEGQSRHRTAQRAVPIDLSSKDTPNVHFKCAPLYPIQGVHRSVHVNETGNTPKAGPPCLVTGKVSIGASFKGPLKDAAKRLGNSLLDLLLVESGLRYFLIPAHKLVSTCGSSFLCTLIMCMQPTCNVAILFKC